MTLSHELAVGAGPNVEGLLQVGELALGFVLSAVVGFEREIRAKSAGLRTHTLVGVGSALFVLISKYGFNDVLDRGLVVVDPSRVAETVRVIADAYTLNKPVTPQEMWAAGFTP